MLFLHNIESPKTPKPQNPVGLDIIINLMANGVTTEWEDIHVKMGNYAPREKVKTGEELFQENMEQMEGYDQAEENKDSDEDFDLDDDFMDKIREKRMAEMKEEAAKPRFG